DLMGQYVFHDVVGVFDRGNLTNADLSLLKEVRGLAVVELRYKITDQGIDALIDLQNLKRLTLTRSQISPKGLQRLRVALPDTDLAVYLTHSQISPQEIQQLKDTLPQVDIYMRE
ncbi:MAG: hypothetical protein HKN47_14185, partial [Pirellulaceae bacterium]|nr:hypothetical protein [Pirellulaceae bacterium]